MANVHTFDGSHKVRQLIGLASQGTLTTPWVRPFASSGAGGDAERAVFLIQVGTLASGETLAAKLRRALTSTGGSAEDIPGAAITTMTETTDERIRSIEIGPGAMSDAEGFQYVAAVVTVAGGDSAAIYGVTLINHRLRYPGTGGQDDTYDEQVIVLG